MMIVEVKNCNNIDAGSIEIHQGKLNIKLAPNGTGKSTIAKAIVLKGNGATNLEETLMPFKFIEDNPNNLRPQVMGLDGMQHVMCFDEEYVKQFNFKQDELLSNSFDILIRNEEYKTIEQDIANLVSETKSVFANNEELELLILALKELGGAFKLTKTGVSMASTGMKGLAKGNKILHIPEGLESYTPFIQCEDSVSWVDWQSKGCTFSELSDSCPFCTSDTNDKKDTIKKVGQEYDKNTIKNLVGIIKIIDKLGDFLSDDAREHFNVITSLKDGLENEHLAYIANIKNQIDNFVLKLEKVRTLSSFQFQEGDKVSEKLPEYKLELQFFSALDSPKMKEAILPINNAIDKVIDSAGKLQGKINIQRAKMKALVETHQKEINEFLAYAGYKYKVEIAGVGDESKLKLKHVDHTKHISGGDQHLSFGERNAFSIILFMYECLSKNPDMIILDDPISSFDKNKKYAILEMLFRRDASKCLKNKTVLMLTHDVEPIIDTLKSLSKKFGNLTVGSFLKLSQNEITEVNIVKSDIKTFSDICRDVLTSGKDMITKLIYLRRNTEIIDGNSDMYQVLSNLLHKRDVAVDKRLPRDINDKYPDMEDSKFADGCQEITTHIGGFDYVSVLTRLKSKSDLKALYASSQNGYEKLQIFRFFEVSALNSVIQKFINETYHVENEYICQLDPSRFDTIPEYVIKECDKVIATI